MLIFNLIYIRSIIFLSRVSCYVLGYFMHNCRWQFLQLLLNFVLIICLLCCLKLEHQLLVLNMSFFQVLFNFFLLVLKTNFHLITLYFLHVFMKKTIMNDENLFFFWLLIRMQIESIFVEDIKLVINLCPLTKSRDKSWLSKQRPEVIIKSRRHILT